MFDAYEKGIVRSAVESRNLRANIKHNTVTSAETFRTCQTDSFAGGAFLDLVEHLCDKQASGCKPTYALLDHRNIRRRKVILKDIVFLYGHRPCNPEIWYLSPYEFTIDWEVILLFYPLDLQQASGPKHQVTLTASGRKKLREKEAVGTVVHILTEKG